MAGRAVARQQDLYLRLWGKVSHVQEKRVQGTHGGGLRLLSRLFPGNEVPQIKILRMFSGLGSSKS